MNELAIESFIEQEIKKFTITDAALAELHDKYMPLKIKGLDDKHGAALVRAARLDVKAKRIDVDKKRKELNENALRFQRSVNGRAKEIISSLEKIETYLGEQENAIEAEKERLKQEAQKAKALLTQKRVNQLLELGFKFNGQQYILNDCDDWVLDPFTIEHSSDVLFEKTLNEFMPAIAEYKQKQQLHDMYVKAQIEQDAIEREKIAAERAQVEKEKAELQAERERLAALKKPVVPEVLNTNTNSVGGVVEVSAPTPVTHMGVDMAAPKGSVHSRVEIGIGLQDFRNLIKGETINTYDSGFEFSIKLNFGWKDVENLFTPVAELG